MLLNEQVYQHSYPYCWRSKTPIIFRAVEQFFIRIDAIRESALQAIKTVRWIPAWGENRISGTVESRPDWVISRQRSWGVPLPVFYSGEGEAILDSEWIRKLADLVSKRGSNVWFELDDAALARELGLPEGTRHRNDTIDVWIDSGVSHQAVLATNPALRDPADMYLEATDQHRGWFQSSLMTSVALHNRSPYKACITHGFVVDLDGKKISKSSSYSKPMDAGHFVGKHGADIVRLWVASINYTDDVPFSEEMFTRLGDTYRRIRNTLRILLGNLHDFDAGAAGAGKGKIVETPGITLVDRWILHRLENVIADCRAAYESYEFHKVYHALNQFCAVDLSSLIRRYHQGPNVLRCGGFAAASCHATVNASSARCALPVAGADHRFHGGRGLELSWDIDLDSLGIISGAGKGRSRPGGRKPGSASVGFARRHWAGSRARQAGKIDWKRVGSRGGFAVRSGRRFLRYRTNELEEFFILSDLKIEPGSGEPTAVISKTSYAKCGRCWRHRQTVGKSAKHPDLCDRCEAVVSERTAK